MFTHILHMKGHGKLFQRTERYENYACGLLSLTSSLDCFSYLPTCTVYWELEIYLSCTLAVSAWECDRVRMRIRNHVCNRNRRHIWNRRCIRNRRRIPNRQCIINRWRIPNRRRIVNQRRILNRVRCPAGPRYITTGTKMEGHLSCTCTLCVTFFLPVNFSSGPEIS